MATKTEADKKVTDKNGVKFLMSYGDISMTYNVYFYEP